MNYPVVTVKNNASHDIFVDSDPNWDDQVLKIDGKPIDSIYTLPHGSVIEISIDWDDDAGSEMMMGVIFADAPDYDYGGAGFYQLTIGQLEQSGNLGFSDGDVEGQVQVYYTLEDQQPWSMTMNFVDVQSRNKK